MLGSAYLMAGMPLARLKALLAVNGLGRHPRYLGRSAFLVQAGFWAEFFEWMEARQFDASEREPELGRDPLFIVGHWRSGTTYLHQLAHQHPALAAPTFAQCCFPDSFLFSRAYIEPVMGPFVSGTRPMDAVRVGLDQPHEDEDALFRLVGSEPLERLVFPRGDRFFLCDLEDFGPVAAEREGWARALRRFVARVERLTGRRVVLKNAFNSLRVPLLAEVFPEATFLHIHRHPERVVPSAIRMWTLFGRQNALRAGFRPPRVEDIIEIYDRIETRLEDDLGRLDRARWASVRFEELEAAPIETVARVTESLAIGFDLRARRALERYVEALGDFRKNNHRLAPADRALIRRRLRRHYERLGYDETPGERG